MRESHGGRIDIGAFEVQPIPLAAVGDYNQNGIVDAADYVVWRKAMGMTRGAERWMAGRWIRAITMCGGRTSARRWERGAGGELRVESQESRADAGSGTAEEDPHPLDSSRPLIATATLRPEGEVGFVEFAQASQPSALPG